MRGRLAGVRSLRNRPRSSSMPRLYGATARHLSRFGRERAWIDGILTAALIDGHDGGSARFASMWNSHSVMRQLPQSSAESVMHTAPQRQSAMHHDDACAGWASCSSFTAAGQSGEPLAALGGAKLCTCVRRQMSKMYTRPLVDSAATCRRECSSWHLTSAGPPRSTASGAGRATGRQGCGVGEAHSWRASSSGGSTGARHGFSKTPSSASTRSSTGAASRFSSTTRDGDRNDTSAALVPPMPLATLPKFATRLLRTTLRSSATIDARSYEYTLVDVLHASSVVPRLHVASETTGKSLSATTLLCIVRKLVAQMRPSRPPLRTVVVPGMEHSAHTASVCTRNVVAGALSCRVSHKRTAPSEPADTRCVGVGASRSRTVSLCALPMVSVTGRLDACALRRSKA
mmetsp:Transcript_36754/g.113358  ORF Transcript_36754/g.113358 Transcript_36754/m.113358 type:complete len:402 (+) Transcript_36754:774-1979(+)